MNQLFNQYSFPIFTALTLILVLALLRYRRVNWRYVIVAEFAVGVVALAIFGVLNPSGNTLNNPADVTTTLQNGKPTLLQFFSHYCTGCLVAEPAVDELVAQISDEFNVLRIDIHTDIGREVRREWGFTYTPEFILFDKNGVEIWRAHSLPSAELLAQAQS